MEYGPVPERWDRVYSQFDEIMLEPRSYGDKEGSVLVSYGKVDMSFLTADEIEILDEVCTRFMRSTSSEMTATSHKERAWIECMEERRRIPFEMAFGVVGI